MKLDIEEVKFPSADGIHTLYGEIYKPKGEKPRGVIQISHGMSDHIGRYRAFAERMAEAGYAVAGHCHLGHGRSAVSGDELGFFAKKNGADFLVSDMHGMDGVIRSHFGGVPKAVMGHSMGSFIARLYAEKYSGELSALIIHATSGPRRGIFAGEIFVNAIKLLKGEGYRSSLVRSIAAGRYNKSFPKEEGANAWLTRDNALARKKLDDAYANFTFTLSGYGDLFKLLSRSNSKAWFKNYSKSLPTLIISGDMDPVGGYGNGVRQVYDGLKKRGHSALTLKLYEGARHELFNETNKDEVFDYIANWLSECGKLN